MKIQVLDFVPLVPEAETANLMTTDQFLKLVKYLNSHASNDSFKGTVKFMVKNGILNIRGNIEKLCWLGADVCDYQISLGLTGDDWEEGRKGIEKYESPVHEEQCKAWVDELIIQATGYKPVPGWTPKEFWRRFHEEDDLRIQYMQGLPMPEGYEPPWRYPEGKPSPFERYGDLVYEWDDKDED